MPLSLLQVISFQLLHRGRLNTQQFDPIRMEAAAQKIPLFHLSGNENLFK